MRATIPSPTAASLGRFGDIPVSLYSGSPEITVPLFVAKGRALELPVSLRYQPSGIRVEEIGGWAGIGWALEAGGTITRTVRGIADDAGNGYWFTGSSFYLSANWPNPPDQILNDIRQEDLDGEPDQFFFSFAGRSGQFVIVPNASGSHEYRAIPYQKLKIEPTSGFNTWIITTEDGTRYTFSATESSTDLSLASDMTLMRHYGGALSSHQRSILCANGIFCYKRTRIRCKTPRRHSNSRARYHV
jgi:hypothetical protein